MHLKEVRPYLMYNWGYRGVKVAFQYRGTCNTKAYRNAFTWLLGKTVGSYVSEMIDAWGWC